MSTAVLGGGVNFMVESRVLTCRGGMSSICRIFIRAVERLIIFIALMAVLTHINVKN